MAATLRHVGIVKHGPGRLTMSIAIDGDDSSDFNAPINRLENLFGDTHPELVAARAKRKALADRDAARTKALAAGLTEDDIAALREGT